jgi:UDP:flavonoid glycosyltransferase YjiC (YdhE family)
MKVLLLSVGTRGDIEPFLAIGAMLRARGHHVICAFPEQFGHLVEGSDLAFASLGSRFIEMLDSDAGKAALGGGGTGFQRILATLRLASQQTAINKELVKRQYDLVESETPDRILYNGKAVYPII